MPLAPTSSYAATTIIVARAESSSEIAALGGKRALTPIIAGSVCGGGLFLLWAIGFAVYFRKRYRRKQRNRLIAAGKAEPRPKDMEPLKEKIIIPPDPAVLLGQHQPGETLFPERRKSKDSRHQPPWSRHGSYTKHSGESSSPLPAATIRTEPIIESADDAVIDEMTIPART
ncbi:hypothetical protein BDN70DRAFT_727256 [Pholiota conissans]|uniref:Uncharacterized protein n=1 Tax=Pholiota conissans TaxID=109636 RepID=A0A9P6D0N2_9AGAR|nr:hypothetical protein BDN70DRAFT_727256 [Pholiota conissans]